MPKFRENRKVSKKCLNFMAYVREVVFHLPRVMIILIQRILALTTLKDFRIGACIAEITICWKLPLGMKNPVELLGSNLQLLNVIQI